MKRVMLMLVLLWPVTAVAQGTTTPLATDQPVAADVAAGGIVLAADPALRSPSEQRPVAEVRAEARPRRRPSMVGYIGDGTIGSQVRLRFDAGYRIMVPDRAEFFYAKCGCYRFLDPTHPGFDPDAPGPGPGIATDLNFQQLYVQGEYAVQDRFSLFAELPVRWLQPQSFVPDTGNFSSQSGLADVRAGIKGALVASPDLFVTVQLQAVAPTGEASSGLGTDHWSVEPALLYYQRLSDRVALESQIGAVLPTDGSAGVPVGSPDTFSGNIVYYGIGPSFELYSTDSVGFGPVIELVGWRVLGGFQTADVADASGINIVNLKVGARFVHRDGSSFYVGYGRALTTESWYDDIVRAEYRYRF